MALLSSAREWSHGSRKLIKFWGFWKIERPLKGASCATEGMLYNSMRIGGPTSMFRKCGQTTPSKFLRSRLGFTVNSLPS